MDCLRPRKNDAERCNDDEPDGVYGQLHKEEDHPIRWCSVERQNGRWRCAHVVREIGTKISHMVGDAMQPDQR